MSKTKCEIGRKARHRAQWSWNLCFLNWYCQREVCLCWVLLSSTGKPSAQEVFLARLVAFLSKALLQRKREFPNSLSITVKHIHTYILKVFLHDNMSLVTVLIDCSVREEVSPLRRAVFGDTQATLTKKHPRWMQTAYQTANCGNSGNSLYLWRGARELNGLAIGLTWSDGNKTKQTALAPTLVFIYLWGVGFFGRHFFCFLFGEKELGEEKKERGATEQLTAEMMVEEGDEARQRKKRFDGDRILTKSWQT